MDSTSKHYYWIRRLDVSWDEWGVYCSGYLGLNGVLKNFQIQLETSGITVPLEVNISVNNPNYFSVDLKKVTLDVSTTQSLPITFSWNPLLIAHLSIGRKRHCNWQWQYKWHHLPLSLEYLFHIPLRDWLSIFYRSKLCHFTWYGVQMWYIRRFTVGSNHRLQYQGLFTALFLGCDCSFLIFRLILRSYSSPYHQLSRTHSVLLAPSMNLNSKYVDIIYCSSIAEL